MILNKTWILSLLNDFTFIPATDNIIIVIKYVIF